MEPIKHTFKSPLGLDLFELGVAASVAALSEASRAPFKPRETPLIELELERSTGSIEGMELPNKSTCTIPTKEGGIVLSNQDNKEEDPNP